MKNIINIICGLAPALLTIPLSAAVNCTATANPTEIRAEGYAELTSDVVITCTGGTPTAAGQVVPQVNLHVFLNTRITSRVLQPATATVGANFTEALLLVDEPNRAGNIDSSHHPLLNCGNNGAPDNGVSGPGVCAITSDGIPQHTYDGTPNAGPSTCFIAGIAVVPANRYGCGRPNVFQARLGNTTPNQDNEMVFFGVPFDPPGAGTRTLRITNLRANSVLLGAGAQILATMSFNGSTAINLTPPEVTVAKTHTGLKTSIQPGKTVRVQEGFPNAWKDRNVSFTLANAIFSAGHYVYSGGNSYPADAAQNVPGVIYNDEEGFQWQNNAANKPPSPNPPQGYGTGVTLNTNYPLNSVGFGVEPTGISAAGVSSAGTRIALHFIAPNESITVPLAIDLHPVSNPSAVSGLMILVSTDSAGAGPYTPSANAVITDHGMAVYEIIYTDPSETEFADIQCTITGMGMALVFADFAPFYPNSAGFPTPTPAHPIPTAVPRFTRAGLMMLML